MTYVSDKIRLRVWQRSSNCCEYCLLNQKATFWTHEIDHIISLKHEGLNIIENLALACFYCNRNKGTDIGSIFKDELIRFYNPRKDKWTEHFQLDLDTAVIQTLTPIGFVTAKILGFNQIERIMERQALIKAGQYSLPSEFNDI